MGSFSSVLRQFLGGEEIRILMVGLDASGKSTILNKMNLENSVTVTPTVGFKGETLEHINVSVTVWRVGGEDKNPTLWRNYYQNVRGLVFVLDSNARERILEARGELEEMLAEDELRDAALLVFANKDDLPNAMNAAEIADKLGLDKLHDRKWHIQPSIATSSDGIFEGLIWLFDQI